MSYIYPLKHHTFENDHSIKYKIALSHPKLIYLSQSIFSPDYSKMPGMKLKKWTITNNTYPDNSDIYYGDIVLTYLFRNPGNYTISLEVEDTNGNVNSTHRNILTVK